MAYTDGQAKAPSTMSSNRLAHRERALIAASRRIDRSLKSRIQSAHRASDVHEQITGRRYLIDEDAVKRCKDFEEEEQVTDLIVEVREYLQSTAEQVMHHHLGSPTPTSGLQPDEEWRRQQIHQMFSQFYPDAHLTAKQTARLLYGAPSDPYEPNDLQPPPQSLSQTPDDLFMDESYLSIGELLGEPVHDPGIGKQPGEIPAAGGAALGSIDQLAVRRHLPTTKGEGLMHNAGDNQSYDAVGIAMLAEPRTGESSRDITRRALSEAYEKNDIETERLLLHLERDDPQPLSSSQNSDKFHKTQSNGIVNRQLYDGSKDDDVYHDMSPIATSASDSSPALAMQRNTQRSKRARISPHSSIAHLEDMGEKLRLLNSPTFSLSQSPTKQQQQQQHQQPALPNYPSFDDSSPESWLFSHNEESVARIRGQTWIDDDTIHNTFKLVTKILGKMRFLCLSSTSTTFRRELSEGLSAKIFLPVYDSSKSHFCAVTVPRDRASVRIYDSAPTLGSFRLAAEKAKSLFEPLGVEIDLDKHPSFISYRAPILQIDNHSCGIAVIVVGLYEALDLTVPQGQLHPTLWRHTLWLLMKPLSPEEHGIVQNMESKLPEPSEADTAQNLPVMNVHLAKYESIPIDEIMERWISESSSLLSRIEEQAEHVLKEGAQFTLPEIAMFEEFKRRATVGLSACLTAPEINKEECYAMREAVVRINRVTVFLKGRLLQIEKAERLRRKVSRMKGWYSLEI